MSCLATAAMKEPLIDSCNGDMIVSNECKILDLDLVKMKKEDVEFSTEYKLEMNRNDKVHAIVAWFDCKFEDLDYPVTLSTSPFRKYTHWKQTVFYMDHDLTVR
jgi:protein arginine N-methyltransferase 1